LDTGYWILDTGYWIKVKKYLIEQAMDDGRDLGVMSSVKVHVLVMITLFSYIFFLHHKRSIIEKV